MMMRTIPSLPSWLQMGGKAIKMFQDFYSAGLEKCWGLYIEVRIWIWESWNCVCPLAREVFPIHIICIFSILLQR